jgi:metal-dependent amidase/aminoacylase/carboxypeptidase family protein
MGKKSGKTILFRAELDALPIDEINTFDHRSVNKAFSHKCGHDDIWLFYVVYGTAYQQTETGTVILLFNLRRTELVLKSIE